MFSEIKFSFFKSILFLALMLTLLKGALAWGTIGHQVIANIAQDNLQPRAKIHVMELLSLENRKNLAEISIWADQHREEYPNMPDHMVRIPLDQIKYNEDRDCSVLMRKICVVKGIEQQVNLLRNENLVPLERLLALKMVVHLIGDIHQPLHASAKTGVPAILNNENYTMHGIWDTQSVTQFGLSASALSKKLEGNLPVVNQGKPEDWANESHAIALRHLKPFIDQTPKNTAIILPDNYLEIIAPEVELRLQQAGVRLGRILNNIFDN
ncbi:MAG: S1/P1 nuclease [Comamonas sp.]|jgi:hypothetical protein|nr:S1/P1 nuclease [Comamonas sp.]